jgi:transketolase
VAEVVVTEQPVPMRILGFPGFAPTGPTEFLLEHAGLTADGIAAAARDLLGR